MIWHTCYLVPIGKPRMTKRDRWAKRPAVMRYRIFADALRQCLEGVDYKDAVSVSWTAYFPHPKSRSKGKAAALAGQRHQAKPDRDNVDKAILDTLFDDDSGIADGVLAKRWDDGGGARIEICFETVEDQKRGDAK
jgi:Holliday junction resolvase RusA-like endonuclease